MDARQADLLRKIDPAELGHRLRAARVAKGMTQTDLAGADVSVGYVSRIESGHRRPNLQVLTDLCVRLGTPVEQLLMGVAPQELEQIKLTLDFAELSLESGQAQAAEAQAREALEQAEGASLKELVYRARFLVARALEAQGFVDDAVIALETMLSPRVGTVMHIKVGIALSRCYRESGDFSKAVEVGEMILEQLADTPLDSSDEAVQMAVTLAAAYFERGDTSQAVRVCRKAVTKAEKLESPEARASAYWNASIMEHAQGSVRDAVPLAERALQLLRRGAGRAQPRTAADAASGMMQLRLDPPQIDEAEKNLAQAAEELMWCSAGPVEIARNDLAIARAHFLKGDVGRRSGDEWSDPRDGAGPRTFRGCGREVARGTGIRGGRPDRSRRSSAYREAVLVLTSIGSDRGAARTVVRVGGSARGGRRPRRGARRIQERRRLDGVAKSADSSTEPAGLGKRH